MEQIMMNKYLKLIIVLHFLTGLAISCASTHHEKIYRREILIEDARQLAQIIEAAHPDPYIRGGGKIAFHRRLQDMLEAIPQEGMNEKQFYKQLLPFVAAIGDGHTRIHLSPAKIDLIPVLPFEFEVVEEYLYIARVYDERYTPLFGAILISIENVPFKELINRQERLSGCDNKYHKLLNLSMSLESKEGIKDLIPEWKENKKIRAALKLPTGEIKNYVFSIAEKRPEHLFAPQSKISLPPIKYGDFDYYFLDKNKKIALLRIDGMMGYREAYEYFDALGIRWVKKYADKVYKRLYRSTPPANLREVIQCLPPATEIFKSLVKEMKTAGTRTLIIDIRKNGGGNSIMSHILIYYLYGHEVMESLSPGFQIRKLSNLYFQQYKIANSGRIINDEGLLLSKNDYDFINKNPSDDTIIELKDYVKLIPTFEREFNSGKYDAYYLPEKIIILCSAHTYSAGYTMMVWAYRLGATIIGTPSAQAGNSFGDILYYKLKNTGITGAVSHKQFIQFPDNPEKGKIFKPHYTLTYDKLASFAFDPNAEILYALTLLPAMK
jgi:hypothetical protein